MTIKNRSLLVAVCQSIIAALTGCNNNEQAEARCDTERRYFYKAVTLRGVPGARAKLEEFYPERGTPGFSVRDQAGTNTVGYQYWYFGLGGVMSGMSLLIDHDGDVELRHESMEQVRVEWARSTSSARGLRRHTGTIVMRTR